MASRLPSRTLHGHKLLATVILFSQDFRPIEMSFVQKGRKRLSPSWERGVAVGSQRVAGTKVHGKPARMGRRGHRLLHPADRPLHGKEQGQVVSLQTRLIILGADSHLGAEPRGKRLQVTKNCTQRASCFSHQAAGWCGGNRRMTESRAGQNERLNGIG